MSDGITLDQLEHDPYETLRVLRAESPVSWVPAIGGWLVTSHELVREALGDPGQFTVDDPRFSTAKVVGPSMLSLDGPEHRRHRTPFVAPFRFSTMVRDFGSWLDTECRTRVDSLRPHGLAELREQLAGPLAVASITRALGLSEVDPSDLLAWYRSIVEAVVGVAAGEEIPAASSDAFGRLRAAVERSITNAPTSLPARVWSDQHLTVDEVVSNTAVLLFGAIETTEGAIATSIFHVLTTPGTVDEVRRRPAMLPRVVEESFRLEPASAVVDRYAVHDTVFGGRPIRAGDFVQLSLLGANRDPAVFPEPDTFDPDRSNVDQHLTFVRGPHVCIGLHLARLEAQRALAAVVDGLPDLEIVALETTPPSGLIFRKPARLTVRWSLS